MNLGLIEQMANVLQRSCMNWTQIIGLGAGFLTALSLVPQVVKTLKDKKAEDVSLTPQLVDELAKYAKKPFEYSYSVKWRC